MTSVLDTTKAALEALDFTEENVRLTQIEAELEGYTKAQDQIRTRIDEINRALQDMRRLKDIDATTAADKLLAGGDVEEIARAASTEQSLMDERETLNATFKNLKHRYEDLYPETHKIRGRARQRAMETAQPLIDAILADARAAAEQLALAHASMSAITGTTRCNLNAATDLQQAFNTLIPLFRATGDLPEMTIPDEVRDTLMPLEAKGRGIAVSVPSYLPGYAPSAQPIETARKAPGPSKLLSWAVPAWAGARESTTFPS